MERSDEGFGIKGPRFVPPYLTIRALAPGPDSRFPLRLGPPDGGRAMPDLTVRQGQETLDQLVRDGTFKAIHRRCGVLSC